jgi:ribonuclease HII
MEELDALFPRYGWRHNKGYPTADHRNAIMEHGVTEWHRLTFKLRELQTELRFL